MTRDRARAAYWFAQAARAGLEDARRNLASTARRLRAWKITQATALRGSADPAASALLDLQVDEAVHELSRSGEFIEVVLVDRAMTGFVEAGALRRR